MLSFLSETWFLWLTLSALCIAGVIYLRKTTDKDVMQSTSAEVFSITVVMFDHRRGEGDIFYGYLAATIFFNMFLAGFIRWLFP